MSSESPSEQREASAFSQWESFGQTGFLKRLGTFWSLRYRDGNDADQHTIELVDREVEEERSPGLPWGDLVGLLGQSVHALGLQTVEADGDDDPPPAMKWSEANIRKLVDMFGLRALNDTNRDLVSLLHLTLMGGQLGCAALLFDYAAEQQFHVNLSWRDGDILGWSLDNRSKRVVDFVLQRLAEQCSSPEETACYLRDHSDRLIRVFPHIMEKYITSDKFCFERGRFDVPQRLFANRADAPIAVLDRAPSSWKPADGSNEVKEFWQQKGLGDFVDMGTTSDTKVAVVSKFLCIDLSKVQDQQMVVKSLLSANSSVDVFKTQSIKTFVQWRWILRVRGDAVIMLLFDALSSALLFFFVAIAWDRGPEYSLTEEHLGNLALLAAFCAKCLPIATGRLDGILQAGVALYLLLAFNLEETTAKHFRFATSLLCILCLYALMEDLRPFGLTGPFISMIGYVLTDIRPFIVLGALMIVTFGAAFRVLFADSSDEDSGQSFRTLWFSFESMFHATLGQFEPEVLHTTPASLFSVWRSLLFNLFLFLAAIVLLSLLIAVLGDTCDRVILTREAESIRSRATCLTRKALKERRRDRGVRRGTGLLRRIAHIFFGVVNNAARLFYQMMLWILLAAFFAAVFEYQLTFSLAVALAVLVASLAAPLLLRRGVFLERLIVRDPLLLKLNSHEVQSDVSVFCFLVPVVPVTPSLGSFWEGRLVAMSRLVTDSLKRSEEKQRRDTAKLGAHITALDARSTELEVSLRKQMQDMQDRLARIEGYLEQMTHSSS